MFEIIVDHRESRSTVYKALCADPDVTLVVRELSSSSYVPHPDMVIERKDATDFVLSIMDRQVFAQVMRLRSEYGQVVFLIEGSPYTTRSAIQPDAIMSAIAYLIAIEGVTVLTVNNAAEAVKMILNLTRIKQEGLGYTPPLRCDKPKVISDISRYLIEGLPAIVPSSATALLDHFGSAMAVFSASTEELSRVPGIGRRAAERIRATLDARHSPSPKKRTTSLPANF